jgi:RimJ/RimL family protein N-acetyltransferase
MIETARLLLRPMQTEDIDCLLAIFADPKVMAAFSAPPFDRARMERWVRRNLEHQSTHGYGLFSVILKTSGLIIGDCGLEHMDVGGRREAELGYDFRSAYWNQGFATEAATAVRDYAFQILELPRLISLIRQGNRASERVARKIGMQLRAKITHHGHGYQVYGIARDELADPS